MPLDSTQISCCIAHAFSILLGIEEYERLKPKIGYLMPGQSASGEIRLVVVGTGFFGSAYGTAESLPRLPLKRIEGLPLLYGSDRIEMQSGVLHVYADVVASAYFLTTRYEEMVRGDCRDSLGRFPGRESMPARGGFLSRPLVDEYGCSLRKWLREAGVPVAEPNRRFRICLTHDVDTLRKFRDGLLQPFLSTASSLLGRRPLSNIPQVWKTALSLQRDPYDTFDSLIHLDGSVGSTASEKIYFFMAGGRSQYDGLYDLRGSLAREVLRKVDGSGAKIGLHVSYDAGLYPKKIAQEKSELEDVLGRAVDHSRHHILNWQRVEDGWELARAGIRHDFTLGYADLSGFRLGVCHPIPLFDPVSCRPFGITAHPLSVMECTLSEEHYMNLDEEFARQYTMSLVKEIKRHDGECVLLWHNHKLAAEPGNYHCRLYPQIINEIRGLVE